ncbi:MAG: AI-2E family transporter [Bacteroidota bacterium]
MKISFQQLFFILAFSIGFFAVLVIAQSILIPLSLALLISFILLPLVKKFEGWGANKELSAFLALLIFYGVILGGITLFSAEIMSLSNELNDFTEKIMGAFSRAVVFINNHTNYIEELNRDELVREGKDWLKKSSGSLIKSTFDNTASFLTGLLSTIIFTFLILIYRSGLSKAISALGDDQNKSRIGSMLKNIQRVGKKCLSGMFLLIIILGLANSIGLWIIGIDNPFLFGFLAAFLSIIPYIGTAIGAILPILYAFMTSDSLWVPFAVITLFWSIQLIESNYLNPKIVGSSLNVNPLVSILSLLIGASVWGVAGMVLFLPFTAILKVFCGEFQQLKPIALLISSDVGDDEKQPISSKWIESVKNWLKKDQ